MRHENQFVQVGDLPEDGHVENNLHIVGRTNQELVVHIYSVEQLDVLSPSRALTLISGVESVDLNSRAMILLQIVGPALRVNLLVWIEEEGLILDAILQNMLTVLVDENHVFI